jgi:pilus assembly protein Flp/PilA
LVAETASVGAQEIVVKTTVLRFLKDRSGATAIEYGLIAGLIAVVIISALRSVGSHLSSKFSIIANNLT